MPMSRQAERVDISRGAAHHQSKPVSEVDLCLLRRIDKWDPELPFAGVRMLRDLSRVKQITHGQQASKHVDAQHGRYGALPQAQHQHETPG